MASSLGLTSTLQAIVSALQTDLVPLEKSDYAAQRLELSLALMMRLSADAEGETDKAFWTDLFSALPEEISAKAPPVLQAALERVRTKCIGPENDRDRLLGELTQALSRTNSATEGERQALAAVIAAIAKAEQGRRERVELGIVENRKRLFANKTSREEVIIDAGALTAYLRRRFPDKPELRAERIAPVPGGRSKATIFFDMVEDGQSRRLVMRKDFLNNFMDCTVSTEFPIIRAAWSAGLRVPEPLWLEEDSSIFSGKFIVFERLAGGPAGTMFETTASKALVLDLAGVLARLHATDLDAHGLRGALEFGHSPFAVREMVEQSYAKHRALTPENILLESAHHWLMSRLDCVEKAASLVHGDSGLNNVLADGDRVSALLDWELAHAGDPAEDLASCRDLAQTVLPWPDFMAEYQRQGGRPVSPERQHFFVVWRLVKYALYAASARQMFESGRDPDLRLAAVGFNTFPRLLTALAREMA